MTFEYVCTRNDLADLLEIPHGKLTHVLYVAKVDSFYKIFEIPKKSGGTRKICAPTGDLKQIQEKLSCASKTIYALIFHTLSKKGKVSLRTARCIEISA